MTITGRVSGKRALVTGAARGLGAAIARMLLREGATVLITDIDGVAAGNSADALEKANPGRVFARRQDVTCQRTWTEVVEDARTQLGGLDILVNNAGIAAVGSVESVTYEDWRHVHAVNLDSVFLGCRAALPLMSSGGGSIVNLSSVSGIVAGHNLAAYNASKAAVRHLSKSVALHCARAGYGVRCNSVHPAYIDTPMLDGMSMGMSRDDALRKLARQIPLGRIGEPDDVAFAVLYLASDESSFITGSELIIDGGLSAM